MTIHVEEFSPGNWGWRCECGAKGAFEYVGAGGRRSAIAGANIHNNRSHNGCPVPLQIHENAQVEAKRHTDDAFLQAEAEERLLEDLLDLQKRNQMTTEPDTDYEDTEPRDFEVCYTFVVSVEPPYTNLEVADAVREYIGSVAFALDNPVSFTAV